MFEPVNSPMVAQHAQSPLGAQMVFTNQQMMGGGMPVQQNPFGQPMPNGQQAQPPIDPRIYDTPKITTGDDSLYHFRPTVETTATKATSIKVDRDVADMEKLDKKRKSEKSSKVESTNLPVVTGETLPPANKGEIVEAPTAYTYMETTGMLRETLGQTDSLNSELMQEFASVRHNRTMKNKYNVLVGLSENVATLLNTKVSIIKEINSSISKSNEMDYKKAKDIKAAQAGVDDDKYIADLYKSFMSNPQSNPMTQMPVMPNVDPSLFGSGVVRAAMPVGTAAGGMPIDTSYVNYQSNITPEQRLWMYESMPEVQEVLVFDDATGNKFFTYMNTVTGEVLSQLPATSIDIIDDIVIDRDRRIARSNNLNKQWPLYIVNENTIASKY